MSGNGKDTVEQSELIWLDRARRGDREAFARLVEAYQGPVYNLSYHMLGDAAEAEDAAQETFVRMYRKLHTYQRDRKLSSWVLSIASHYCIDRLRRRRFDWLSLDDELVTLRVPSSDSRPEDCAIEHESRDEIQTRVERLAPAYRVPLILRYWYDFSYSEISEVMGISTQAVKSRLHRARLQLANADGAAVAVAASPA